MSRGDESVAPNLTRCGDLARMEGGMTLREYYAAMAMQGLLACEADIKSEVADPYDVVALAAVQCADALLAELAK